MRIGVAMTVSAISSAIFTAVSLDYLFNPHPPEVATLECGLIIVSSWPMSWIAVGLILNKYPP